MPAIEVKRTVHIEQPSILEEAHLRSISYIAADQDTLLENVSFGGQRDYYFKANHIKDSGYNVPPAIIRQSDDNGSTWRTVSQWQRRKPLGDGIELDIGEPNWVLHPQTGALLRMYRTNEDALGLLPWDEGSPWATSGKLWWEMSTDQGNTWSKPQQLIMSGDQYDDVNWAPGVSYGKNSGSFEAITPVWLDHRNFVIPYYYQPAESVLHRWAGGAILGTWTGDRSEPTWQRGECVLVERKYSNQGSDEPSITLLPDGRLFMVLRMRVDQNDGTTIPSGKFYAVSSDRGLTWSEKLLRYTDGSQVYSPACFARVFCSAKNQRLYLITNILDEPTYGCDPRTTLQIVEIDTDSLAVVRDSVTVIETRDPQSGQPDSIRFSNFVYYEDRHTGDVVLFMTGCPGDVGRSETCGVPPHAYRYDIILPEN